MMKFENPKMNISMFEMENVVTTSTTAVDLAQDAATALVADITKGITGGTVTYQW